MEGLSTTHRNGLSQGRRATLNCASGVRQFALDDGQQARAVIADRRLYSFRLDLTNAFRPEGPRAQRARKVGTRFRAGHRHCTASLSSGKIACLSWRGDCNQKTPLRSSLCPWHYFASGAQILLSRLLSPCSADRAPTQGRVNRLIPLAEDRAQS